MNYSVLWIFVSVKHAKCKNKVAYRNLHLNFLCSYYYVYRDGSLGFLATYHLTQRVEPENKRLL